MSNKQTHTVNIVFDGNFDSLIVRLEQAGIKTKFSPAGLAGSQHTLEIDDEKVELGDKDVRSSKATKDSTGNIEVRCSPNFYGKQDYSYEGQRRKALSIKKLIEKRVMRDTKRTPPSPPRFFEELYMTEEDLNLIKDNSNDR